MKVLSKIINVYIFTVTETFYFPSWTVSARWENGERTVSTRWANGEKTVSARWTEFGDWLITVNGERKHKRGANASAKWTIYARRTICQPYVNAKIRIKLHVHRIVCIAVSLKWYYLTERYVNAEWTVSTKWTLCECTMRASLTVSANGAERGEHKWTHGKYTVRSLWAHFEHTEKLKRRTFYGLLR